MDETEVISASDLFADDPTDLFIDVGVPEYNRRLSDKILGAFNHAYSVGELDTAEQLRVILVAVEARAQAQFPERRANQATDHADLWVEFVAARERYRKVAQTPGVDSGEVARALDEMKEGYKRWSLG